MSSAPFPHQNSRPDESSLRKKRPITVYGASTSVNSSHAKSGRGRDRSPSSELGDRERGPRGESGLSGGGGGGRRGVRTAEGYQDLLYEYMSQIQEKCCGVADHGTNIHGSYHATRMHGSCHATHMLLSALLPVAASPHNQTAEIGGGEEEIGDGKGGGGGEEERETGGRGGGGEQIPLLLPAHWLSVEGSPRQLRAVVGRGGED